MQLKIICHIQITYLIIQTSLSQYSYHVVNPGNTASNYYNTQIYNSDHNYQNLVPNPQNNDCNQENKVVENCNEYNNEGECYCSCQNCQIPEECCQLFCSDCNTKQESPYQGQYGAYQGQDVSYQGQLVANQGQEQLYQGQLPYQGQAAANLLMVPYPYPLLLSMTTKMTPNITLTTKATFVPTLTDTTTQSTRTVSTTPTSSPTTTITTTTSPPTTTKKSESWFSLEATEKPSMRSKYLLASSRRSMPLWVPKYGIVPIPDHVARRLIVKLRETKEMKDFTD